MLFPSILSPRLSRPSLSPKVPTRNVSSDTVPPVSAVALDVAAVRARFSALENELVFFDGPGGSQVPDEVIEAIADYLRTSNANVSGPYSTSRRTEALVDDARRAGGG